MFRRMNFCFMILKFHIGLIAFSFSVLIATNCLGQRESSGEIIYDYSLNLKGINIERTAHLYFSNNQSIFYHSRGNGFVTVDMNGNVGDISMTVNTVNDNSGRATIDFYRQDSTGNTYFFDFSTNELIVRELVFIRAFLYRETIPRIKWQISDTQKEIGKFHCIKAVGEFRGRKYTAWFTTEIAVPLGPWKLNGLPGLILEAYDSKHEVSFVAKSVQIPIQDEDISKIRPPQDGISISFNEAKEIYVKEQKRILTKMNSTNPRNSEDMGISHLNLLEKFNE